MTERIFIVPTMKKKQEARANLAKKLHKETEKE